jgi:hypothetical protein
MASALNWHDSDELGLPRDIRGDVEAIPEDLDLRAAKLVDAQREEIEAVAEALRKRRYLDASEVAEIVGAVAGKTPSWPVSENLIVFRTRALALIPPLNGCLWSQCGGAALSRPGGGRRRPQTQDVFSLPSRTHPR